MATTHARRRVGNSTYRDMELALSYIIVCVCNESYAEDAQFYEKYYTKLSKANETV